MIRSTSAALAALLTLGAPVVARAQAASDSVVGLAVDSADTSLDQAMALADSTRALLAQDYGQTRLDQSRLDSLEAARKSDLSSAPSAKATSARDQAALAKSQRVVKQDLKRDKETRARLGSIEKTIRKEQAPAKKTTARAVRPSAGSH